MDISIPMQTRMKEDSSMIDLSLDYHAHILPGCDHGSSSVDMSLKQINMAKEAGVQTICATPHFYPHKESVSSFIESRRHLVGTNSDKCTACFVRSRGADLRRNGTVEGHSRTLS